MSACAHVCQQLRETRWEGMSDCLLYWLTSWLISKRRLEAEETRSREKLYQWTLEEMQVRAFVPSAAVGSTPWTWRVKTKRALGAGGAAGVQRGVNIDNLLCNSLYWGRADLVSSNSPTIYCKLIITALGKTCSLCALNQSYACNVLNDPSIHSYRMYYYTLHQALTLINWLTKQLSVTLNWVAIKLD